MMVFKRRLTRHPAITVLLSTLWMCRLCETSSSGEPPLYADRPKIATENGSIIFQVAPRQSIKFKTASDGKVVMNNVDIGRAITQTYANVEAIRSIKSGQKLQTQALDGTRNRIGIMENRIPAFLDLRDMADKISHLRLRVADLETDNATDTLKKDLGDIKQQVTYLRQRLEQIHDVLEVDECADSPCMHAGTCVDGFQSYRCHCPKEWQGVNCTEDVDECLVYADTFLGCQNNGTCINVDGGFRCECEDNWHGVRCRSQQDNCTGLSDREMCAHGACHNLDHAEPGKLNYQCLCEEGWQSSNGSNPACQVDIDECSGDRLCSVDPPVKCMNTPGSFLCGHCPQGYTGNGFVCTDINECAVNNGGCSLSPLVDCFNTIGSRACGPCPAGYLGDGRRCRFVGICNINNGGCHSLAKCNEHGGDAGVLCLCPSGFSGSGVGPDGCVSNSLLAGCVSGPCQNGGTCEPIGSDNFTCACAFGFIGRTCGELPDPCDDFQCQNGGTCNPSSNRRYAFCLCGMSFTGYQCEMQRQACSGPLIGEGGQLDFPLEPVGSHGHPVSCAWTITTHPHKVLQLRFSTYSLGRYANYRSHCRKEFIQVNDGPTTASRVLKKFCLKLNSYRVPVISTYNQVHLLIRSDNFSRGEGFNVTWSSRYPVCGEDLSGRESGLIKSPRYPEDYPPHRDCVYRIAVDPGSNIRFTFPHLDLGRHTNCNFDFLEIRDGYTEEYPLLAKYCTSQTPPDLSTSGPFAFIRFHSDADGSGRGFEISYTSNSENRQGCGGHLTGSPHGTLQSPGYPGAYHQNKQCVWLISLVSNTFVELTFSDFDLGSCNHSSLRIRDGADQSAPLLYQFCGTQFYSSVRSRRERVLVEMISDDFMSGQGFRASYATGCGGDFRNVRRGSFASPGYPLYYNHDQVCIYTITDRDAHIINFLPYIYMQMNSTTSCEDSYLEFHDGRDTNAPEIPPKACHYQHAVYFDVKSSGASLTVKYKADASANSLAFSGRFHTISYWWSGFRRRGLCEIDINGNSGDITIPPNARNGIWSHILSRWTCSWKINVPPGMFVKLSFSRFHFVKRSGGAGCGMHALRVRADPNIGVSRTPGGFLVRLFNTQHRRRPSHQPWTRLCGDSPPKPLILPYHTVEILMYHRFSDVTQDFEAHFEAVNVSVCGGNLMSMSGTIKTPNYPGAHPHDVTCEWRVTVPEGHQIRLTVVDFELEDMTDCEADFFEIRNWNFTDSPLLGRYCGQSLGEGHVIFSSSNTLYMKFVSTSYALQFKKGFKINYDAGATGCGGLLKTATGGFQSPYFPDSNPHSSECFWVITVSHGYRMELSFDDFNLPSDSNCIMQFVEVRDSERTGRLLKKMCGQLESPESITSQSRSVWVIYKSNSSYGGTGFRAHYDINCVGLNLRRDALNGVIESPNYPEPYPHPSNCTWWLQASHGNRINVSFASFHFDNDDDNNQCGADMVKVTLMPGRPQRTEQVFNCTSHPSASFAPSAGTVVLSFLSSGLEAGKGFRLEWIFDGCGEHLKGSSGSLVKKFIYTVGYLSCEWKITVPFGHRVHFETIISTSDYSLFEVFAGLDRHGPQLVLQRGKTTSQHISVQSTGNTMSVYFQGYLARSGLNASYTAIDGGCGGNLSYLSGVLQSANGSHHFGPMSECDWYIQVEEGHTVLLTLIEIVMDNIPLCNTSYVQLYDGKDFTAPLITDECGTNVSTPVSFRSSSNTMLVHLRTGHNQTGYIFKANFRAECGGLLNADVPGSIRSPNLMGRVHNRHCLWHISSSIPTRKVSFSVTDMGLGPGCLYIAEGFDAIINVSGVTQNRYCGRTIPPTFHSQGSAITVSYVGEPSPFAHAFRAVYSSADSGCGGTFTALDSHFNGHFISPWFPDNYPDNIECTWEIKPLAGNGLVLTFSHFHLAGGFSDDYVEVRSPDVNGGNVTRLYGSNAHFTMAFSSSVWIRFRSNEADTSSGFEAQWSPNFRMDLTGNHGRINTYYPESSAEYRWTITVNEGFRIAYDIPLCIWSANCESGFLAIYDGSEEDGSLLNRLCGRSHYLRFHRGTTTDNLMTIKAVAGSAWLAYCNVTWHSVAPEEFTPLSTSIEGCQGRFLAERTPQNLTSPGYPDNYANDLECVWIIQAPLGSSVTANITSIETERHTEDCAYDYLQFLDGGRDGRPMGTYCGVTGNVGPIQSRNHTMAVRFITDSTRNYTGFTLTYQTGCGGILPEPRGLICSLDYPDQYPPDLNCTWQMSVAPGRTISLTFEEQFDIAEGNTLLSNAACSGDFLQLFNGEDVTSPPLIAPNSSGTDGRYCGTSPPGNTETGSNHFTAMFITDDAESGAGFSFNVSEVHVACGGTLPLSYAVSSGHFTSPNYPDHYPHNVDCRWVIRAPPGKEVQLDFEGTFDIESTALCYYDYLFFHDGGTENSPPLGAPICGTRKPSTIKSSGNFLYARFRTDANATHQGFKAKYSIARCGGRKVASLTTQILESPDQESSTMGDLRCQWVIDGHVGHYLTINITRLALPNSVNCTSGALQILDPLAVANASLVSDLAVAALSTEELDDPAVNLFHGCSLTSTFIGGHRLLQRSFDTSEHLAVVTFRSNANSLGQAFQIQFTASREECGGVLLTTPSGSLSTPKYPQMYAHRRMCIWKIQVARGRKVSLSFQGFDFQGAFISQHGCSRDYVEIINGLYPDSPSLGRFCGDSIPPEISSSGNKMKVVFKLSSPQTSARFLAEYNSDSPADCGGILTGTTGTISHPSQYHSADCEWYIQSPLGSASIHIWFYYRVMQNHASCEADYVEILEGAKQSRVGRYCGHDYFEFFAVWRLTKRTQSELDGIVIPFSDVLVRFKSDASVQIAGFSLRYEVNDCGGVLTDPNGIISTDGVLNGTQNCAWLIQAPEGSVITVHFTNFTLDNTCHKQFLKIQNGGSFDSPTIGKFCGNSLPSDISSASNQLRIVLVTKGERQYDYRVLKSAITAVFQLEYSFVHRGCGGIFRQNQGHFHTPNFPRSYPHNTQCEWAIFVERGFAVKLTFNNPFDLEASSCETDFVKVYDVTTSGQRVLLGTWCNNTTPPEIRSTSTGMLVVFQSDNSTNGNGFSAHWGIGCGGNLTNKDGVIFSPGLPVYHNNLHCIWTLAPHGYQSFTLTIHIRRIQGGGTNCPFDSLTVYSGNSSSYMRLAKFCGYVYKRMSIDHLARLEFKTDATQNFEGFKIKYNAYNCHQVIFVPPLKQRHVYEYPIPFNVDCFWKVTTEPGYIIYLRFHYVRLPKTAHCSGNYLEIHDGSNSSSPLLRKLCGSSKPLIKSSGNQLFVRLVTDSVYVPGTFHFSLYPVYAQCGGYINTENGTLLLPANGTLRAYGCKWTIEVDPTKVVEINITKYRVPTRLFYDLSHLKITDGRPNHEHTLYETSTPSLPGPLTSSSNIVTVDFFMYIPHFRSSPREFQALFHAKDAVCPHTHMNATKTSQTLTFTGPGRSARTPLQCKWTLDSGADNLQVSIMVNEVQFNQSCDSEYLELQDSAMDDYGQAIKLCDGSSNMPDPFYSKSQLANVIYYQSEASPGFSFDLSFKLADCTRNYIGLAGRVTTPGFPAVVSYSVNCTMRITAPDGMFLALYFVSFRLETLAINNDCATNFLEVFDSSGDSLGKKCGDVIPSPVFLSSKTAVLSLRKDGQSAVSYDLLYVASHTGAGCGGNITDLYPGVLTNPGYPNTPEGSQDCTWRLSVSSGLLKVYFESVVMPEKDIADCSVSYVKVNNRKLCTTVDVNYTAVGRALTVQYVSRAESPATVFKLLFVKL